jgi:SAM-dependent methyltransferase
MSDVIPTGQTPDSEFLFSRMTERTLALARPGPGRRVLDVAAGAGQDARALAAQGAWAAAAEPSQRMCRMAGLCADAQEGTAPVRWIRGWSDALPFASGSFDAVICKGAIDHFDRPERAVAEMARVAKPDGRVVVAVANFESLACRLARARDVWSEETRGRGASRRRRCYDAPSDHFTRYDPELVREELSRHLALEHWEGISLGWGAPGWASLAARLPAAAAERALQLLDAVARRVPDWADVLVVVGRPRRSASTAA